MAPATDVPATARSNTNTAASTAACFRRAAGSCTRIGSPSVDRRSHHAAGNTAVLRDPEGRPYLARMAASTASISVAEPRRVNQSMPRVVSTDSPAASLGR